MTAYLEQQLVFGDPLYGFEEVGAKGQLVP